MANLPMVWTKHLKNDEEAKKRFESTLRNSSTLVSRLVEILKEKDNTVASVTNADYDNPSWAYSQAHRNGYRQALKDILDLFNFMENK